MDGRTRPLKESTDGRRLQNGIPWPSLPEQPPWESMDDREDSGFMTNVS